MTITVVATVFQHAILRRRDQRDPLGVWAAREQVTGDASGGIQQVDIQVPANVRAGFVYNCQAAEMIGPDPSAMTSVTVRLLTNWPPSDSPGVAGADFHVNSPIGSFGDGSSKSGSNTGQPFINAALMKVLLFDPRSNPLAGVNLLEIWSSANTLAEPRIGTAWGYYWDRGVMDVPGGPRFPGAD